MLTSASPTRGGSRTLFPAVSIPPAATWHLSHVVSGAGGGIRLPVRPPMQALPPAAPPPITSLSQSEERFRLLVESVKDYAIFMLDLDGRVISWNAGAEQIKGYRADEVLGQHFAVFYTPEDIAVG